MQPWRKWGQAAGMRERIWRCDCGAGEYVSVGYDEGAVGEVNWMWPWLNLDLAVWGNGPWERVRMAWQVLRHGKLCYGGILLDPVAAEEVYETPGERSRWSRRRAIG